MLPKYYKPRLPLSIPGEKTVCLFPAPVSTTNFSCLEQMLFSCLSPHYGPLLSDWKMAFSHHSSRTRRVKMVFLHFGKQHGLCMTPKGPRTLTLAVYLPCVLHWGRTVIIRSNWDAVIWEPLKLIRPTAGPQTILDPNYTRPIAECVWIRASYWPWPVRKWLKSTPPRLTWVVIYSHLSIWIQEIQ